MKTTTSYLAVEITEVPIGAGRSVYETLGFDFDSLEAAQDAIDEYVDSYERRTDPLDEC